MKNPFIRLNTALIIPDDIAPYIIFLSKILGEDSETYFILDGKNYHPHITLYSPEYPAKNLDKVFEIVESTSLKFNKINCHILEAKAGEGFIGLEIETTREIKQLHEELVLSLNSLRDGHIREKYLSDYQMNFSDEKMKNIKKYGYPNSMSFYHSHLTIIRFKDESRAEEVAKTLKLPQKDFIVSQLGIYEMGEHGTCKKLIKKFALRG